MVKVPSHSNVRRDFCFMAISFFVHEGHEFMMKKKGTKQSLAVVVDVIDKRDSLGGVVFSL